MAADGAVAPRPRRRGQPVLGRLCSTNDFTRPDLLGPADRMLILFLLVVLTDEDGCLTSTYQALRARFHDRIGHWAAGKSVPQLQKACGAFLGRSALRRPTWDRVVDLLGSVFDGDEYIEKTAIAAGLFCLAVDLSRPSGEYQGEIHLPDWVNRDPVTVGMITDGISHPVRLVGQVNEKSQAVRLRALELENEKLRAENERYKAVIDALTWAVQYHVDGGAAEKDLA